MGVLLFILCFFAIFIILQFRAKIDGTNIKVRIDSGRKHESGDIRSIAASEHSKE